jgi:HSP20 family protein
MNSHWSWPSKLAEQNKLKSTLLALSLGLAVGFAVGQSLHTHAESSTANKETDGKAISIPVNKNKSSASKEDFSSSDKSSNLERWARPMPFAFAPWPRMFHDSDMDRMFRDFDLSSDFNRSGFPSGMFSELSGMGSFMPRLDTSEQGNEIIVTAEVPGIDEKNLDVSVTENSVTIRGTKEEVKEPGADSKSNRSNKRFQAVERAYGSFERTVVLPCKVNSDKAQASLKNGVLTLTIPKSQLAQTQSKKVELRPQ